MSTRLTNALRDEIVRAALEHRFKKDEAAYKKARTALADALYKHTFAAAERTAKRLPEGWLVQYNTIEIEHPDYGSWQGRVNHHLELSRSRLMPSSYSSRTVKVGKGHPLYDQATALADQYTALQDAKKELRNKLKSLVYTFTTTKKLLEAWPEGKKFIPKSATAPTMALVPVQLASEVNELLGIA